MTRLNRRQFLHRTARGTRALAALSALAPALREALAMDALRGTGTIQDVAHIVVLTQENRSFDHYFGALRGVCGFGDRFAIPVPGAGAQARPVWQQPRQDSSGAQGAPVLPFHLDTQRNYALMRAQGTPHTWLDAQQAWDHGRLSRWTQVKGEHAMGYYTRRDLPFQYALADAFTVCDAYHCSFQGGTNTNRLFLWTGSNDPHGRGNGPATYNDLDSLTAKPELPSYTWTTYPERLQAAGVSWQVYQDMADNYDDNPLAGFKTFRDAYATRAGAPAELKVRALSTRDLRQLRADVLANRLPQVSWIVADAPSSEHPERSSPAQGADYTARVLAALTANPEVWRRTVLILNFDENDGYFDHVPPPAPPSCMVCDADPHQLVFAGESTVATAGEYHEHLVSHHSDAQEQALLRRAYGLGPRVPMLVISPWSRGGWVNSQVFDHTSVIRFMERRFGVMEPNISAWRRAVCGDLTSTLDFSRPDRSALPKLPNTRQRAQRAGALPKQILARAPRQPQMPAQEDGARPARALPYQMQVDSSYDPGRQALELRFVNIGRAGAVFHVYDQLDLAQIPRRYTVEAGKQLTGVWPLTERAGAYDLWLLGPNGFHRRFAGRVEMSAGSMLAVPELRLAYDVTASRLEASLYNHGAAACTFELRANAYFEHDELMLQVMPQQEVAHSWSLRTSEGWYDFSVRVRELDGFVRRFAGRMENLHAAP